MAYEIIIKKRFLNRLESVLNYLENEWGNSVATKFRENVDKHILLISTQPFVGVVTGREDVRSVLITKHNRLVYKISRNKIIILNMYDTRTNPEIKRY